MGLRGSKGTEDVMREGDVIQLVAEHMSDDPGGRKGQGLLKHSIAIKTGLHLKR